MTVIALAFLQMDGQMTFYALSGSKRLLFLRLLHGIHQGSQFFSSTMVMDPTIQQSSSALPELTTSFCSAYHLTRLTNYNPSMSVSLAHSKMPGLSDVR